MDARLLPRASKGRLASGAAALFVCLLGAPAAASAQTPCDPAVPRSDTPSGYRLRGDRCEGTYRRLVASFGVQLVSLIAGAPADLCVPGTPVHMVWPTGGANGPVRVQAESVRPLLYYRLNVERQAASGAYAWPPDPRCSNDVALRPADVGVTARVGGTLGGKPLDVLLPVSLSADPSAPVRPPYRAMLMPGGRLREVYVSLWRYGSGSTPAPIVSERPLSMRPYPAGRPVIVTFTPAEVSQPGLHRARASVEFEDGGTQAVDFYFLHGR